ncbi:hypothetical protein RHGRI_005898 [Rhododendron griersonianum]|uniref:Uncharacterized protein n=1 Tax=Rhododendron griersonianum TaxID=479676 RepID=A0AAV6LDX6_9ERIC|nr:hypothetical protein RHGRI_005898 [Rhododendron griersonianum]
MHLFLFPVNSTLATSFGTSETKSEQRWFVDLYSVQIQPLDASSPPPADAGTNPNFLFGLDKKTHTIRRRTFVQRYKTKET